MTTTTADEIRVFTKTRYLDPARRAGASEIVIRAGDIHKEMRLHSRHPQVCGALGATKFEDLCGIKQTKRTGPHQGATSTFHFDILTDIQSTAVLAAWAAVQEWMENI